MIRRYKVSRGTPRLWLAMGVTMLDPRTAARRIWFLRHVALPEALTQ